MTHATTTDARRNVREVTPAEFNGASGETVLIDVRESAEFETGHIPGSINIPRGVLALQVGVHPAVARVGEPALSHKERPVVLVCLAGGRSALSCVDLQRLGFADVSSLAGGINAWGKAGLPLVVR